MTRFKQLTAIALGITPLLAMTVPALAAEPTNASGPTLQQLREQVTNKAGDPAFDYRYATAALDAGYPAEAIIALQRVLSVQPTNAMARAELARAYAMTGDIDTAKQQFETIVGDPTIPDPVRQRFTNLIRNYDQKISGGGTQVTGYVDAQWGHDSNINSATALTSITIPLFSWLGPGQLGPQSRAIADSTVDLTGGLSVSHGVSRANRLFGSVLINRHDNRDSKTFDQQSLTATAGFAHTLPSRNVMSISVQNQAFRMGGTSVRNATGLIAQYTRVFTGDSAWTTTVQAMDLNYKVAGIPDARRYSIATGLSTSTWLANGQLGRELTTDRLARADAFNFASVNLGWQHALTLSTSVYLDSVVERRRHLEDNVMFLVPRRDTRLDVAIGLRHQLRPHWQLNARLGWSRNHSNIALYDFSRFTASAGVRYEF